MKVVEEEKEEEDACALCTKKLCGNLPLETPFPKDGRKILFLFFVFFCFRFFFLMRGSVFFLFFLVFLSPSLCFISSHTFHFITRENPNFVRDLKRNSRSLLRYTHTHTHTHKRERERE